MGQRDKPGRKELVRISRDQGRSLRVRVPGSREGRARPRRQVPHVKCGVSRSRLAAISAVSLLASALLGFAVSRGFGALRLEWHVVRLLGRHPSPNWGEFAGFLAIPVIVTVLLASLVVGVRRHALRRVVVGAVSAGLAFVVSEHIEKPLVGQRFGGQVLSFPSGHVTGVCATALAMWIALYPVLGRSTRIITFLIGAGWVFLTSVAVVGAFWHTPLDDVGSVLLSTGIVTGVAAISRPWCAPKPAVGSERERVTAGV
jgi:hypothetical protein